eukprot:4677915-Prymnesium_polylepis.1
MPHTPAAAFEARIGQPYFIRAWEHCGLSNASHGHAIARRYGASSDDAAQLHRTLQNRTLLLMGDSLNTQMFAAITSLIHSQSKAVHLRRSSGGELTRLQSIAMARAENAKQLGAACFDRYGGNFTSKDVMVVGSAGLWRTRGLVKWPPGETGLAGVYADKSRQELRGAELG